MRYQHGTQSGYSRDGCRCDECRAAKAEADRRYRERNGESIAARKRAYHVANAERIRTRVAEWQAANPERVKATAARHRDKHRDKLRKDALDRYYRLMAEDPERVRKQRREWAKTPRGRAVYRSAQDARRRGVPLSREAQDWWASLVDPECHYCGEPANEIDHVLPISKGGTGDLDNLVPACRTCNARKGDRVLV